MSNKNHLGMNANWMLVPSKKMFKESLKQSAPVTHMILQLLVYAGRRRTVLSKLLRTDTVLWELNWYMYCTTRKARDAKGGKNRTITCFLARKMDTLADVTLQIVWRLWQRELENQRCHAIGWDISCNYFTACVHVCTYTYMYHVSYMYIYTYIHTR